ncbi:MAG TPA: mechanosensitive ion channel domain-containing protein [Ignavibacteria bacterium]
MDILDKPLFHIGESVITLLSILLFAIILLIIIIVAAINKKILLKKVFPRHNINEGVAKAYTSILTYLILVIGVLIALGVAGIPVTGLFAGGAALLIGIGFGIQNIVNNWVSGIIILFERPIKEGDFIEVDGILGTVTAIAARSTRINTLGGVTIIIPNSRILEQKVINRSYYENTQIDIPVIINYDEDIEKVKSILLKIAETHPKVLKDPVPSVAVSELIEYGIKLKLWVWIKEQTAYGEIRSYVNYELLKEFRKEGINVAHPKTEIRIKEKL